MLCILSFDANIQYMYPVRSPRRTAMEKAVVLMKGKTRFSAPDDIQDQGYIDIWWIIHDGGLLLLVAHLLQVCLNESWCGTSAPTLSLSVTESASLHSRS